MLGNAILVYQIVPTYSTLQHLSFCNPNTLLYSLCICTGVFTYCISLILFIYTLLRRSVDPESEHWCQITPSVSRFLGITNFSFGQFSLLTTMSSPNTVKSKKSSMAEESRSVASSDEAKATAFAKSVVRILFISLVLDLVRAPLPTFSKALCLSSPQLSFTMILPLFPRLLDFYRDQPNNVMLNSVLEYLNSYKAAFARPISARFDVVLLGGAMGSLFSLLQAFASPIIGSMSDKFGCVT